MSHELLVDRRRSVGIGIRNADLSGERIVCAKVIPSHLRRDLPMIRV